MSHAVDQRWLPQELWDKQWFDLNDPTAVEVGNWIFDPAPHAHYAGWIQARVNDVFIVRWYKSFDNTFTEPIHINTMAKRNYWWADPVLQEGVAT